MSTTAVSTPSIYQELQAYFQQRRSDVRTLGQALEAGDLAAAQQEFNAIQALGQGGPFASGDAFQLSQRQQDFAAIGQALLAGDLSGAQTAFAQLLASFHHRRTDTAPAATVANVGGAASTGPSGSPNAAAISIAGSSVAANGPEIVLNLGNVPAGEQITIGLNNTGNGAEQVTVTVANAQSQNPEQITFNLTQNSNEQIILNLFNNAAPNAAQGSGLNVAA